MTSVGESVFEYSKSQLEENAERFIKSFPGLLKKIPPLNPEVLLEKTPDVKEIRALPLLVAKFKVEGMVLTPIFMHREMTVVIDQGIMDHRDPSRYNITIAEELAHIHLHRAVMLNVQEYEDFVDLQAHPKWARAERDAKYWARALLMPRHVLEEVSRSVYRQVVDELGFQDSFQICSIFVSHLATRFEIPSNEVQKRIDSVNDLRQRLEKSIACRSTELLSSQDYVSTGGNNNSRAFRQMLFDGFHRN